MKFLFLTLDEIVFQVETLHCNLICRPACVARAVTIIDVFSCVVEMSLASVELFGTIMVQNQPLWEMKVEFMMFFL